MPTLSDAAQEIERILKLRTLILGLQFFEEIPEMEKVKNIKRPEHRRVFCQIITQARTYGWTIGVTVNDLIPNSFCPAMLGLYERPAFIRDGSYKGAIWFENKEDAKKYEDSMPVIPSGNFNGVAIGPLSSEVLSPDMVLAYGNPAQMMLLINGLQWKDYERLQFFCVGESSCADAISQCFLSNKPSLAIPCYGERRFGHAQDDELVIALPTSSIEKIAEGLQKLRRKGVRFPIPLFGVQPDPSDSMPDVFKKYHSME